MVVAPAHGDRIIRASRPRSRRSPADAPPRRGSSPAADRRGRAGHVRHVRLLPFVLDVALMRWRHIACVMQPAVPVGRRQRAVTDAVVDHPAALEMQDRDRSRRPSSGNSVAELVLADEFAMPPRIEPRVQRGPVPPGEKPGEPDHIVVRSTRVKAVPLHYRPSERKRREWLYLNQGRARRISSALPG